MKVLFVGCGSIGKRHIKNLKKHKGAKILACRVRRKEKDFERKYGLKVYKNLKQALKEKPDAVFVTNPTGMHIKTALKAARAGANLFIEKPISHNLKGIKELQDIARKKKLKVFIGYNMRFLWALRKIKELIKSKKIGKILYMRAVAGQYLPDWRPKKDYRESYSAKKKLGGGVILDLSHEIDYVRWFLGEAEEVFAFADKISNLEIETEDMAEITLRFKNGAAASIHLDYLQRTPRRYCEIVGTKGTIMWNMYSRGVKLFDAKSKKLVVFKAQKNNLEKTYVEEMRHFIKVLKGKERPLISLEDGKKVLEIALAAKKSAKARRVVRL